MRNPAALIGSSEACRILGISRSTLTYWQLTGRLVPVQSLESGSGRTSQHLWRRTDVEALAASRAEATA
jgi:DNA-binding transcriptional MerR regulator